ALEQGAFAQVLADGEGGVQLADAGHGAEGGDPAYGGRLAGQFEPADPGAALGGAHTAGQGEQEAGTAGTRGPLDRHERPRRSAEPHMAKGPAAWPLESEVLGADSGAVRALHRPSPESLN